MSQNRNPTYQIVLDRLIAAREEGEMSVEELAAQLQLTVSEVEAFENGNQRLDFAQTRQWCQALGLDFTNFVLQVAQDIDALEARKHSADPHPLEGDDAEPTASAATEGDPQ